MVLDLRLGDHLLGEDVQVDAPPSFQVVARGTEPLKLVQLVRDGQTVYSNSPGKKAHEFQYTDMQLSAGKESYYYLRCQQANNRWGWSSAVWVHRRR